MKIVNLSRVHERQYFCCLEEWSNEIREAGDHKECWYAKMKDKGLRVKIAENEKGEACGMIQYLPVEISSVEGHDLVFCFVHMGAWSSQGDRQFSEKRTWKILIAGRRSGCAATGGQRPGDMGNNFAFFYACLVV